MKWTQINFADEVQIVDKLSDEETNATQQFQFRLKMCLILPFGACFE